MGGDAPIGLDTDFFARVEHFSEPQSQNNIPSSLIPGCVCLLLLVVNAPHVHHIEMFKQQPQPTCPGGPHLGFKLVSTGQGL